MTLRIRWALLALAAVATIAPGHAEGFGAFVGEVVARWLTDNRQMELVADFAYLDPRGKRWGAPKGSVIDGASIPQVFWTATGGPFEGAYRNASVVHDVACVRRNERWEDVHRMFYYAMRAGGVSATRAAVMYAAVYRFGPRWQEPKGFWGKVGDGLSSVFGVFLPDDPAGTTPPPPAPPAPAATEADVQALEALVQQHQPATPDDVERLLVR